MLKKLAVAVILALTAVSAHAETIAIIGTGDVAKALGPGFAALGHTIVYGSRDPGRSGVQALVEQTGDGARAVSPAAAADAADIVVLAVPGLLVGEITVSLGDLTDKILIDPTNPMRRGADGELEHAAETSNGQIIQSLAPGAHVVKAFNTLNWRTMVDPDSSGGPVSIPLAGDSADAKASVAELCRGLGLEPVDLGGIRNARWIEGMLIVWINNRYSDRPAFEYHLRTTN